MTDGNADKPGPVGSHKAVMWGRALGASVGCIIFAAGLYFVYISIPTVTAKFSSPPLDSEDQQLLILTLIAYAIVAAIGLIVIGASMGARHVSTRIGFILYVALLVGGIVVIAS